MIMTSIGLAIVLGILSLFIKLSFGVWFLIWFALMVLFSFVDAAEKQEKTEEAETKRCTVCAEKIQLAAKKCRYCNEAQP